MNTAEKFSGLSGIPSEVGSRLDRNFGRVADITTAFGVTGNLVIQDSALINPIFVDATAGNLTVYLPSTPAGITRTVIKQDSSANTVTIDGNGANINGSGTYVLNAQYDSITVAPTGVEWLIIAVTP